jgi:hypothetical protein
VLPVTTLVAADLEPAEARTLAYTGDDFDVVKDVYFLSTRWEASLANSWIAGVRSPGAGRIAAGM